jgi:hypothetical protein
MRVDVVLDDEGDCGDDDGDDDDDDEEEEEEEEEPIHDNIKKYNSSIPDIPMYPYRAIFKANEVVSAPATIRCYVGDEVDVKESQNECDHDLYIEHRGHTHAEFKRKNAKMKEGDKDKEEQNEQQNGQILDENIGGNISTESFPQFNTYRKVIVTVHDEHSNDEVVWVDGIILSQPELTV